VPEDRGADQNAGRDADEPGLDEAPAEERRRGKPPGEERQRVVGIAAERHVPVVRELPDRREDDDREPVGHDVTASQAKPRLVAP
jgi:hypothetical protein